MFKFFQLIIGNFGLSYEQSKLQFALWAIMASVSIWHDVEKTGSVTLKRPDHFSDMKK